MNGTIDKSFFYLCDIHSRIISSINPIQKLEQEETTLVQVLPESKPYWESLRMEIELNQVVSYWKGFVSIINEDSYVCFLALLDASHVIVIGMKEMIQELFYEEIVKINSQLTNKIRELYREKHSAEADAYYEISKMNNELANARRELKKKNYELEELNSKLENVSIKDPLTDLYNRRFFNLKAPDIIHLAKRIKKNCTLVLIDINNFKQVNDSYGHLEGDKVLIYLSHCIQNTIRQGQDTAFRLGGDEFLIILEATSYDEATTVISRIKHFYSTKALGTSLAAGILEVDYHLMGSDFTQEFKEVDALMYEEKQKMKS